MLNDDMTRFVDLHRGLGVKFRTQHGLLRSFVAFAEAHGDEFVRRDRVIDWASQAPSPPQRRNRLVMIRRFALALCAEDIRHEAPAADALGHATFRRRTPHVFTADETIRLLGAAAALLPAGSIRPLTYTTLFGLLAATGTSEALAIRLDDITADGLVIRQTKFQKSRLLPLHNTTSQALNQYLSTRMQLRATADTLFVSGTGNVLSYNTVQSTFLRLARSVGLRGEPGQRGPRIHDLRHNLRCSLA